MPSSRLNLAREQSGSAQGPLLLGAALGVYSVDVSTEDMAIQLTEPIGGIDIIESGMPIKPAPLNLTIVTGIIFGPVILRAKDINNQPIDLTGWRPFAEVRKKPGSTVILDLAPILSDGVNGEITIPKWTDEQTYDLKVGDYQWSLILEDPFGDRRGPYMQGAFTITATPTKPPEGI